MSEFCYDFEFRDTGKEIDPLSLGVVRDDGQELYLINAEADLFAAWRDDFLRDHVLTSLPVRYDGPYGFPEWDYEHPDSVYLASRQNFAVWTRNFITEGLEEGGTARLWAWYASYDFVILSQLYGSLVMRPKGFPMRTGDIRELQDFLGDPVLPEQPTDGEHNALVDARFNWVRLRELRRIMAGREGQR